MPWIRVGVKYTLSNTNINTFFLKNKIQIKYLLHFLFKYKYKYKYILSNTNTNTKHK